MAKTGLKVSIFCAAGLVATNVPRKELSTKVGRGSLSGVIQK